MINLYIHNLFCTWPFCSFFWGWQNMFTQAWCSDIAIHNLNIHNLKSEKYNQLGVTSLPPLGHSLLNWLPSKSWRLGDRNHFLAASAWAAKSASFWAARNRAHSFWKVASSSELRSFTTWVPRERAEPMMERTTEDRGVSWRAKASSWALMRAISYTCFSVTRPATSFPVFRAPFSIPAAAFRKQETVGWPIFISNVLSGFTKILVGRGMPSLMSLVFSLNSLQNWLMETPHQDGA